MAGQTARRRRQQNRNERARHQQARAHPEHRPEASAGRVRAFRQLADGLVSLVEQKRHEKRGQARGAARHGQQPEAGGGAGLLRERQREHAQQRADGGPQDREGVFGAAAHQMVTEVAAQAGDERHDAEGEVLKPGCAGEAAGTARRCADGQRYGEAHHAAHQRADEAFDALFVERHAHAPVIRNGDGGVSLQRHQEHTRRQHLGRLPWWCRLQQRDHRRSLRWRLASAGRGGASCSRIGSTPDESRNPRPAATTCVTTFSGHGAGRAEHGASLLRRLRCRGESAPVGPSRGTPSNGQYS